MRFTAYVGNTEVEIDDEEIKNEIRNDFTPDEIFGENELESWALENDFIKKEDAHQYVIEHIKE